MIYEALFLSLQRLGICGPFFNVIGHMYNHVISSVKYGKIGLSDTFPITRGANEGYSQCPLLFNVSIKDITPILHQVDNR